MATVIELDGKTPQVADDAFIAPTAVLIGDVTVHAGASIWFGAVLRGDNSAIVIGAGSNVQDNCVIHCAEELPTIVGENVTVGHMAMLEGCVIGDGALIGMGAIVLQRATVGAISSASTASADSQPAATQTRSSKRIAPSAAPVSSRMVPPMTSGIARAIVRCRRAIER